MKNHKWTDEENQRLKDLVTKGGSVARASAIFKRNFIGVRMQAKKLGTPFPSRRAPIGTESRPDN